MGDVAPTHNRGLPNKSTSTAHQCCWASNLTQGCCMGSHPAVLQALQQAQQTALQQLAAPGSTTSKRAVPPLLMSPHVGFRGCYHMLQPVAALGDIALDEVEVADALQQLLPPEVQLLDVHVAPVQHVAFTGFVLQPVCLPAAEGSATVVVTLPALLMHHAKPYSHLS